MTNRPRALAPLPGDAVEQDTGRHPEAAGQPHERGEEGHPLAVLVEADLGAMDPGRPDDRLLAQFLVAADPPHPSADDVGEPRVLAVHQLSRESSERWASWTAQTRS